MKTKAPIWLKFFAVSVLMLFFVVLLLTTVYMYQMLKKENSIVDFKQHLLREFKRGKYFVRL